MAAPSLANLSTIQTQDLPVLDPDRYRPLDQQAPAPDQDQLVWLNLFDGLFADDAEELDKYQAYYDGEQNIVWNSDRFKTIFGSTFESFRDNWCEIVADACAERMQVLGFTVTELEGEDTEPGTEVNDAGDAGTGDPTTPPTVQGQGGTAFPAPIAKYQQGQPQDGQVYPPPQDPQYTRICKKSVSIWKRNRMDAKQELLFTGSLVKGKAYVIVWPSPKDAKMAEIHFNDASLIRVWYDENGEIYAAAKQWRRFDGATRRNLYYRDRIEKWLLIDPVEAGQTPSEAQRMNPGATWAALKGWRKYSDLDDPSWPIQNPYDTVPVFPFLNKPHNAGEGTSEIKNVVPQQDAINKMLADMMVASEYGAFKQKIIASKGRPKEGWKHGPNQLWSTSDTDAKWGQFEETPLSNYIEGIGMWVEHVAATSRTPQYYLRQTGALPSGESLKTSEAGLVKKCQRKSIHWGNTLEDMMRFAIMIEEGDSFLPDGIVLNAQWAPFETRMEKEFWETQQIKSGLGIPDRQLFVEGGYTEDEVDLFVAHAQQQQAEQVGNALLMAFESGNSPEAAAPNGKTPPARPKMPMPPGGGAPKP